MSEVQQSIEDRVKKEIAFHANCEPSEIKNEQSLIDELGFDSLDMLECVMSIEDEFGSEIPDDAADKLRTVQQVIDYVTANVKA